METTADNITLEPQPTVLPMTKDEASAYLVSTDWVEPYLIKHYTNIEPLSLNSNKFAIEAKRKEARNIVNA